MGQKSSGGGTPFESMSHEEMLQWLDQANSGVVQAAADRLAAAAKAIHDIAGELKVRPQHVAWKGEGATAFRTWSGDLANATLRLGDYSAGASQWLARASDAIAEAQASIPRDTKGSEANLAAAEANPNDPDAAGVTSKSLRELSATGEANRQEAAAQMRKLAQSYQFSAQQMDGLEKPSFPPPPAAVMPAQDLANREELGRADGSGAGARLDAAMPSAPVSGGAGSGGYASEPGGVATPPGGTGTPPAAARPEAPVGMEIDGAAAPPQPPSGPAAGPGGTPGAARPDGPVPPVMGAPSIPPGTRTAVPSGSVGAGRPPAGARPPVIPGQGTATGRPPAGARPPVIPGQGTSSGAPTGRAPGGNGIVGGRPTPPSVSGRPGRAIPHGTVIGTEGTQGRMPMGHGAGTGAGGSGAGPSRASGGRRFARETGGIVGGSPQQQGPTRGGPFTTGGTGLVRNPGTGGTAPGTGPVGRGGAAAPPGGQPQRRDEQRGERPDYLAEDEQTWQQNTRRAVPPVIE